MHPKVKIQTSNFKETFVSFGSLQIFCEVFNALVRLLQFLILICNFLLKFFLLSGQFLNFPDVFPLLQGEPFPYEQDKFAPKILRKKEKKNENIPPSAITLVNVSLTSEISVSFC